MTPRWDYDMPFYFFTPSQPRAVKGGIRSQSGRRKGEPSWWAERWMDVLRGFNMGGRLDRGRAYARKGQVMSIDIRKGKVAAKVQGSRSRPYAVSIKIKQLDEDEWKRVASGLTSRPSLAAKLLAGRMPRNIEDVFGEAGLSLFPGRVRDMGTDCNCPDWANPCKHIAAVYILLGEEFERDPFLIFRMRGSGREEILDIMGLRPEFERSASPPPVAPEPLPAAPEEFWGMNDEFGEDMVSEVPAMDAALPKRLGSFPFWRGEDDFMPAMEKIYHAASPEGMDAFVSNKEQIDESAKAKRRPLKRS